MNLKDILDLLTAVGTCAAVIVALYVSLAASRASSRLASVRAGLVAARHLQELETLENRARSLTNGLSTLEQNFRTRPTLDVMIDERWLRSLDAINADLLIELAPIPRHAAGRLGRAVGAFAYVANQIAMVQKNNMWPVWDADTRERMVVRWLDLCASHITPLQLAIEQCIKAAEEQAPDFTAEEVGNEPG
ncbi:MAG: hypothetical protein EOO27_35325 [Comamonadaceae bacterium]|nr:MAG: hypothetical protein EOO27_35325 [Comamonadaceae bacterium]